MQSVPRKNLTRRSRYGWFVLASCFVMVFATLGFTSSPRSLYLTAITGDMQIPRSIYSLNESFRYGATAILNVFFGALVAKYGVRRLIACGFLALVASTLLCAFSTNVVMFYLAGMLQGVGLAWTTTTIVGNLVEKWFSNNKGTIMGFILAANGLGGALASQLISRMIYTETAMMTGWRLSYLATAGILAVIGVIASLIIRNDPGELSLQPITFKKARQTRSRGEDWEGIPFETVKHSKTFYTALVTIFCTGFILQAINSVSSAHLEDTGIDPVVIANVLSLGSFFLTVSKMSAGFSVDKLGLRATMLICYGCGVVGITCLAFASNPTMAYISCIIKAFAQPLETVMLPLLAKDLFGRHSYSKIMGIFVAVNTFGYAVGTPLMNLSYDLFGTYRPTMLILIGILIAVAVVMQLIIAAAKKERSVRAASE